MQKFKSWVGHAAGFIKSRLGERSTWIAFGAAVAAASVLDAPWSYVSFGVGMIAAMVPDNEK